MKGLRYREPPKQFGIVEKLRHGAEEVELYDGFGTQ